MTEIHKLYYANIYNKDIVVAKVIQHSFFNLGTCVQAPHSHSWGGYQYHNAAIIGLDTDNEQV